MHARIIPALRDYEIPFSGMGVAVKSLGETLIAGCAAILTILPMSDFGVIALSRQFFINCLRAAEVGPAADRM
jgi:hypothetical protein